MNPVQYSCGQCQGGNFPEGMIIFHCSACQAYIHPGCWDTHVRRHVNEQQTLPSEQLEPRRGKIRAYGIIQWDN